MFTVSPGGSHALSSGAPSQVNRRRVRGVGGEDAAERDGRHHCNKHQERG